MTSSSSKDLKYQVETQERILFAILKYRELPFLLLDFPQLPCPKFPSTTQLTSSSSPPTILVPPLWDSVRPPQVEKWQWIEQGHWKPLEKSLQSKICRQLRYRTPFALVPRAVWRKFRKVTSSKLSRFSPIPSNMVRLSMHGEPRSSHSQRSGDVCQ